LIGIEAWRTWWVENGQGKSKSTEKTFPLQTSLMQIPDVPKLSSNPGHCSWKQPSNRLRYGTVFSTTQHIIILTDWVDNASVYMQLTLENVDIGSNFAAKESDITCWHKVLLVINSILIHRTTISIQIV
jgi:hypothetical protein